MASIVYKNSTVTLSPTGSGSSYDTGSQLGVGAGQPSYARISRRANEYDDLKIEDGFGTGSGRTTLRNSTATLTPTDSGSSYDTGSQLGVGAGQPVYAFKRSAGVKLLSPSAPAGGGGGPTAMSMSPVEAQWSVSDINMGEAVYGDARVTQLALELALASDGGEAWVTQHAIELAMAADPPAASATMLAIEASLEGLPGDAHVTQLAIEVAMRDDRPELYNTVARLAPTDGAKGESLIPTFELYLDNDVIERFSTVGVVVGTQPYAPGVLSFGSINREIDPQGTDFRVSELQMEFDNSTGIWSVLKAQGLTGRTCRVKLADPRLDISLARTIFTGIISPGWVLTRAVCRFTVVDIFASFLNGTPFSVPVNLDKYPAMPDTTEPGNIVPIVMGYHLEAAGRRKGQLPAYLIHTDYDDPILGVGTFRCVACQGNIEGITNVFVNGVEKTEGVDWVASSETRYKFFIDNNTLETIWYITLLTDPRDETANPPSEDATDGVRVTWSGAGYYNIFYSPTLTTLTNPARQLFEFMRKHTPDFRSGDPFLSGLNRSGVGMLYADFDNPSVSAAELYYDQNGITSSFAVTSPDTTMADVINAFAQSFGLMVTSSVDGKVRFAVRANAALSPGFVEHIVEGVHIVRDSISFSSVQNVLGSLNYNYDYDWIADQFNKTEKRASSDGASQNFGGSATVDLLYVRDDGVAAAVVAQILYFSEESRTIMTARVDPHLHDDIAVADVIAVTAVAAPAEDGLGFKARFMRVVSTGFDFSSEGHTAMTIRAIDTEAFAAAGEGQAARAFSDIFETVADPVGIEQPALDSTGVDNPYRTELG